MFTTVQSVVLQVRTGRTEVLEKVPGKDGYLGLRPDGCPRRTGGTAGVFGGALFRVIRDAGRVMQVIGVPSRYDTIIGKDCR